MRTINESQISQVQQGLHWILAVLRQQLIEAPDGAKSRRRLRRQAKYRESNTPGNGIHPFFDWELELTIETFVNCPNGNGELTGARLAFDQRVWRQDQEAAAVEARKCVEPIQYC